VAVLLLGIAPFLIEKPAAIEETSTQSPEALMEEINVHLSRTIPSPMEPMMPLMPSDESITQSGGVQ
jgi:hypothetical protein